MYTVKKPKTKKCHNSVTKKRYRKNSNEFELQEQLVNFCYDNQRVILGVGGLKI